MADIYLSVIIPAYNEAERITKRSKNNFFLFTKTAVFLGNFSG